MRKCTRGSDSGLWGDSLLPHHPGLLCGCKKVDPPEGSTISTIGVLESRIWGFHFLNPPEGRESALEDSASEERFVC